MTTDALTPAAELAARREPGFPGESAEYSAARQALLAAEIEARRVLPRIAATFPLADAAAAHRLMESSAHIGKIVLVP